MSTNLNFIQLIGIPTQTPKKSGFLLDIRSQLQLLYLESLQAIIQSSLTFEGHLVSSPLAPRCSPPSKEQVQAVIYTVVINCSKQVLYSKNKAKPIPEPRDSREALSTLKNKAGVPFHDFKNQFQNFNFFFSLSCMIKLWNIIPTIF